VKSVAGRAASAGLSAGHVGMDHLERQVGGLGIGERTLSAQAVAARHLAMVGREDDHGVVGEAERIQL